MSYRVGTSGLGRLGIPDATPALICDSCGAERSVCNRAGVAFAWFLDRKRAPGWSINKQPDGGRMDYCAECVAELKKETS